MLVILFTWTDPPIFVCGYSYLIATVRSGSPRAPGRPRRPRSPCCPQKGVIMYVCVTVLYKQLVNTHVVPTCMLWMVHALPYLLLTYPQMTTFKLNCSLKQAPGPGRWSSCVYNAAAQGRGESLDLRGLRANSIAELFSHIEVP